MLSSGRTVLLVSVLTLLGSLPALANRKDLARGSYGESSTDSILGPSVIAVSDSNGPLAEITSFGRCNSTQITPCGWNGDPNVINNGPNSSPNFIYFYVVRLLRTPNGPLKLTIPGKFVDSTLGSNFNFADFGIIGDDQTNIAACSTPESNSNSVTDPASLTFCAAQFFDGTDSSVTGNQAVLVMNSGLQANDTIEIHIDSFVPPACYAPLTDSPIDPSNCPANALVTFALNGDNLTTSPSVVVVAPTLTYPLCPPTAPELPFCLAQQLNISGASTTTPYDVSTIIPFQGSSLPISISATATGGTPNFAINSTSKISWNGQTLATTFSTPSNTPTVSANVSSSLLASAGTERVTVVTAGVESNPIAYALLAQNPQITSFSPTARSQGSGPFTITVNGTGFVPNSIVQWNTLNSPNPDCSLGDNRPTHFVSSTQLTATIVADDLRASTSIAPVMSVFAEPGTGSCNGMTEIAEAIAANTFSITPGSIPQLSAISLGFGNQPVGAQSSAMIITVTNNGNAAQNLTINSSLLAGANPGDFMIVSSGTTCTAGKVFTPGESCSFALIFSPVHAGSRTATLKISNNSVDSTLTVALTGTGVSPVPTLTSISPTSGFAGSASFTLTITGTNFTADSTASFGGNPPFSITSQLATQLVVTVASTSTTTAGVLNVTVTNPAPGGGTTASKTFTVNNPVPTVTTLSPPNATVGSGAFTLTVNGTNFNSSSIVNFNGAAKTTTLVSATQLTASITAADIAIVKTVNVTVTNPTPGGGTSGPATFAVNNPLPMIAASEGLSPTSATVGGMQFTLTVNGTNFVSGATVSFNGSNVVTTFVNSTQVTAVIPEAALATAGILPVTVSNPMPGGGASNTSNFTINNPLPMITSLNPTTVIVNSGAFIMTVNGTNFVSSSVVNINGSPRATTFVNSTRLTSAILAGDVTTLGNSNISVTNPAPGGGASGNSVFTVNPLVIPPMITSANTTTYVVGAFSSFTVTATGIPTPTLSESGALPSGVNFNAVTGVLSGIPVAGTARSYPITLMAQNGVLPNATQSFTLTVISSSGSVPIQNPSFEITNGLSTSCGTGCAYNYDVGIPGWTVTGNGGSFQPSSTYLTLPAGDGQTIAYSEGGMISQVLTTTLQANSTYALSVDVGHRLDGDATNYTIELVAGGNVLNSVTGNSASITAGSFATQSVSYTSPATVTAGELLEIRLISAGNQGDFDNVTLTVISSSGSVPIQNPSFEITNGLSTSCGTGCAYNYDVGIPGWTVTGNGGSFQPSSTYLTLPAGDGQTIAYSEGGMISQVLTTTLQANSTYALSVDVGHRLDGDATNYTIELVAGGNVLNSVTGNSASITAGSFATQSVSYTSPATVTAGELLEIRLISAGNQGDFDNVTLTVISSSGSVPIQNPSFEITNGLSTSCGTGCAYNYDVGIPGWTVTGNGGSFQPSSTYLTLPAGDGQTIAYSEGGMISQVLTTTLQANSTYALSVDVGHRLDGDATNYTIELVAGGNVLNSVTGNSASITAGSFATQSVSYTSPATVTAGELLEIRLISAGNQGDFDNVTLTVISSSGSVPIQNPSFEITNGLSTSCGTGCAYNYDVGIPGWTVTGNGGSFQPSSTYLTLPAGDGQTIAYSEGGMISQVLTTTLQANSTYALSVDVGHRLDGDATNYTIELVAGGNVLNSVTGNSASITAGSFATQSVSYTSPATVTAGELLEIRLISAGNQGDFDNVTLTVN